MFHLSKTLLTLILMKNQKSLSQLFFFISFSLNYQLLKLLYECYIEKSLQVSFQKTSKNKMQNNYNRITDLKHIHFIRESNKNHVIRNLQNLSSDLAPPAPLLNFNLATPHFKPLIQTPTSTLTSKHPPLLTFDLAPTTSTLDLDLSHLQSTFNL